MRTAGIKWAIAAQYLQAPELPDAGVFQRQWFQHVGAGRFPFDAPRAQIIQSWDTAMVSNDRADWSVCIIWLVHDDCFYLMDIFRRRLVYPDLKAAILRCRKGYDPNIVIIEDKGAGTSLLQDFYHERVLVEPYRCNDEKEVRAGRASVVLNQGRVFLSAKHDPMLALFLDEVLAFPGGRHDDQADSMVQAIDWWEQRKQRPTIVVGRY